MVLRCPKTGRSPVAVGLGGGEWQLIATTCLISHPQSSITTRGNRPQRWRADFTRIDLVQPGPLLSFSIFRGSRGFRSSAWIPISPTHFHPQAPRGAAITFSTMANALCRATKAMNCFSGSPALKIHNIRRAVAYLFKDLSTINACHSHSLTPLNLPN